MNKIQPERSKDDDDMDLFHFRCCCNCVHIKHGAAVVGVLELLVMAYQCVNMIIILAQDGAKIHLASTVVAMTGILIGILVITLMFYGIITKRPIFLIPHLIMQAISIAVLVSLLSMTVVGLASEAKLLLDIVNFVDASQLQEAGSSASIMMETSPFLELVQDFVLIISIFLFTITLIVALWFFRIVHKTFLYVVECQAKAQRPKRNRNSISFVRELR